MKMSVFVALAVCLMSSAAHGISYSRSCSWVNGKEICNEESGSGNVAMGAASAHFGGGSSSQQTYAGVGTPGNIQSSGQRVVSGDYPGGYYNSNPDSSFSGSQSTSGSSDGGPFAGGFSFSSGFGPNVGSYAASGPAAASGGFGFASAGSMFPPGFPFSYVPQRPVRAMPSHPEEAEETAEYPVVTPFNPAAFVGTFMGGNFGGAMAFAGR